MAKYSLSIAATTILLVFAILSCNSNNSSNWPPLYGGPRLDQDTIQYIHKFYCKDCQMDQQAAERAKAEAAGVDQTSGATACEGEIEVEVKEEQTPPVSPQTVTDDASLMQALDKNKESLKRKLMMRRSLHELVDQGIYPHFSKKMSSKDSQESRTSDSSNDGKTVSREPSQGAKQQPKKTPTDFIFGKMIGEGSFSTVYLAKEISSGKEMAVKVLEKKHIMRERKTQYVMREKEVLMMINHPFFIRLYYTFQDSDRLYFVLTYAKRGELLDYLHKLSSFDEDCSKFYTAEIVSALEYLHGLGIIHRDMKPENILLTDEMHILITDFGSAKILKKEPDISSTENTEGRRKHSFVGTAHYVSPEILTSKTACASSDLWAVGCILFQFLSGECPFRGGHEYQIFQKITKLEYEFPDGFLPLAKDLVQSLLKIEPGERLGSPEMGGYEKLKSHKFFSGIDWEHLPEQKPPDMLPYLPANSTNPEPCWSKHRPGLDDKRIGEIITANVISEQERKQRLEEQARTNDYHKFVEGNLILKQGLVDKRKGLFARRRMFLLTEGPHLYYVDPGNKVLKGQIPWSNELKPELKNFKIFFIHTPNRTYYLEDPAKRAEDWVKEIEKVFNQYYTS